jgi:hypothetical protein
MSETYIHSGHSIPLGKAKYHPDHQNASEEKVSPKKWPSHGEDPSLRLRWQFSKGDWDFQCHDRSEHWAIYKKTKPAADSRDPDIVGFELIRIRRRKKDQKLPSGTVLRKGAEYYPSDEDFGTYGFAHSSLDEALAKFLSATGKGGQDE